MVKIKRLILFFLTVFLFSSIFTCASSIKLVDDAGLYSEKEKIELDERLDDLSNRFKMDIVIHTSLDTKGLTTIQYMDKFWEDSGYGLESGGVMLFCDMQNREIRVHTEKLGMEKIDTDKKVEKLLDAFFDNGLKDGKYFKASSAYLDRLEDYLLGQRLKLFEVILSFIASLVLSGFYYILKRHDYSKKTNPVTFNPITNSKAEYTTNDLNLIRKYSRSQNLAPIVTSSSGRSSSGGTRYSSTGSGRTYGGGGRKF